MIAPGFYNFILSFSQKGFRKHKWFFILDLWIGSTISFYCSLTNIDNSPYNIDNLCPPPP